MTAVGVQAPGHVTHVTRTRASLAMLTLGALGVVFGDLGTSPLYALQECFTGPYPVAATPENVKGAISMFLWALVLIVSVKYVALIMRADNQGEGGILALLSMAVGNGPPGERAGAQRRASIVLALGFAGAALLYGDGVITPAISVLSAVEGLEIATPAMRPFVVPISVSILIGLFALQRFGTGRIGTVFGIILGTWFVAIAAIGTWNLMEHGTAILSAIDPRWGARFFHVHGVRGVAVLGAVVLCLTGVEALYADMGHFGRRPIQLAWFFIVFPALVLSYLGQGAVLLDNPAAAARPFFNAVPSWALLPMVGLATAGTVVASQALIAAAFSLTRQAAQLGYLPRVRVAHTSDQQIGQIYLPGLNWTLLVACLLITLTFRSSGALAAAFGLAVAGTMAVTTILFGMVARARWGWSWPLVATVCGLLLVVDVAFLSANVLKIAAGGWLPLVLAAAVFVLMSTWTRGRALLRADYAHRAIGAEAFVEALAGSPPPRVRGTAVFMHATTSDIPVALLHNLKHNQVLHETVILLTVLTERVPYVEDAERITVAPLGLGFWRVVGHYGYLDTPNVPNLVALAATHGVPVPRSDPSYYLSRETVVPAERPQMALWRERLFGLMLRNAVTASAFFGLKANRVVELGAQIEI